MYKQIDRIELIDSIEGEEYVVLVIDEKICSKNLNLIEHRVIELGYSMRD